LINDKAWEVLEKVGEVRDGLGDGLDLGVPLVEGGSGEGGRRGE
jgi:hypothetical protein